MGVLKPSVRDRAETTILALAILSLLKYLGLFSALYELALIHIIANQ